MENHRYIIDCSGAKVPVGDKLFSAKCWVGNTGDFLEANSDFIIEQALRWEPLPAYSIAMPIYRSGCEFLASLKSLLNQNLPDNTEIILYVNQPRGKLEPATIETLRWIIQVFPEEAVEDLLDKEEIKGILTKNLQYNTDHTSAISTTDIKYWKETLSRLHPRLRAIFEQVEGGTPVIYRRLYATLVKRIVSTVEKFGLKTKAEKASSIGRLMESTIFSTIDDDIIFKDSSSFSSALKKITAGKSILLGRVSVSDVKSSYPRWDEILKGLMNIFFKIKYQQGTAILSPKAAAASDLFHLQPPRADIKYGDQVWLASAAADKEKIYVDVETTIYEEEYPSNAEMNRRLAAYLETGKGADAIEIFENILPKGGCNAVSCPNSVYSRESICDLISALRERDFNKIKEKVNFLLTAEL